MKLVPDINTIDDWPGRPVHLSWDKEDVDVSWPLYDVKACRRRCWCKAIIKRIVRTFKKKMSLPVKIRLMKGYMGLPPGRESDWFTCPSYFVFDSFVQAVEANWQSVRKLEKKHKEEMKRAVKDGDEDARGKSVEGLGDGDMRIEEPAQGKKRPVGVLDGDGDATPPWPGEAAPESPLKKSKMLPILPVVSPLRSGLGTIVDLTI